MDSGSLQLARSSDVDGPVVSAGDVRNPAVRHLLAGNITATFG
jgi:hypothetical protein